jgi:hypothetical protein
MKRSLVEPTVDEDGEAFVLQKARQLGLDPAELGGLPELTVGDDA